MELALPILAIFFAVFTQSLAGFGVALVAMALLPGLVGIQVATPLVALVGLTIEFFLLIRYREALDLHAVWPVALASIFGIPLGVWALKEVDEQVFLTALGVVISGYALYALLNFKLPELRHRLWAYATGLLAGALGGAYNTSGPPVIIYGNCRRWPPAVFKSNLQGFFLVNSAFVVLGHALSHNLTPNVWRYYLWALPAIGVAILAGGSLDRFVNPVAFRKIVLWLLVAMGIRLLL
ncbi:MAG: sulfite exporter TauE/SafE family protein [Anaerolineales bacterium]|nr:sulfite exporter TauE/SafE family protein [Anaerolineales bacterium]